MCVIALSAPIVAVWAEPSSPMPSLLALEHAVARFETWLGTILNGRGWEEDGLGEETMRKAPLFFACRSHSQGWRAVESY